MADLALLDAAPHTALTAAGTVNGSIDIDRRRRADRILITPIVSAAVLLLIDLSIVLHQHGGGSGFARLGASGAGLLAGPVSSDACPGNDNRLDRAAIRVLLSAP